MIIIADSEYLSIDRKLKAYNLYNGINLKIKALVKDLGLYYYTGTELGIVDKDYVFDKNFIVTETDEVCDELIDGLCVLQIIEIVKESNEDVFIISDDRWYSKKYKFIKALIDTCETDVYLIGYGEDIPYERLEDIIFGYDGNIEISINDEYIENITK